LKNIEIYQRGAEFIKIGNKAVLEAQEENRKRGIPNVYSRNGKIYYELPNGEITDENPFEE